MVGHDAVQLIEPEERELREHFAFVGDGRGQDHVEGREAVGGHDQQSDRRDRKYRELFRGLGVSIRRTTFVK